jgi:nitroreductase
VGDAPVVFCVVGLNAMHTMSNGQSACTTNCAIVTAHMMLQATREGLASCWIAGFSEDRVRALIAAPQAATVVAVLPVGYADEEPDPRDIKPLSELVCLEHWS